MTKMICALLAASALFVGCNKESGGGDGKTGATGDKIGIAECDDYVTKMQACIAKAPAEGKAALESGLKTSRDAWKQAAAGPGKDTLKTTCKTMVDALANNPMCK